MKHKLCWHPNAWDDYQYWITTDKKILTKINELIRATDREPFVGIGKPEPLQYMLKGFWSRRITREHRLVYTVNDEYLIIISCRFHYK